MNILAIGDIVGSVGCKFLREHLSSIKKLKGIDLVIANGENSADGNGLTPKSVQYLFDSGVDVITSGNHSFAGGKAMTCMIPARPFCARQTTRPPRREKAFIQSTWGEYRSAS